MAVVLSDSGRGDFFNVPSVRGAWQVVEINAEIEICPCHVQLSLRQLPCINGRLLEGKKMLRGCWSVAGAQYYLLDFFFFGLLIVAQWQDIVNLAHTHLFLHLGTEGNALFSTSKPMPAWFLGMG